MKNIYAKSKILHGLMAERLRRQMRFQLHRDCKSLNSITPIVSISDFRYLTLAGYFFKLKIRNRNNFFFNKYSVRPDSVPQHFMFHVNLMDNKLNRYLFHENVIYNLKKLQARV